MLPAGFQKWPRSPDPPMHPLSLSLRIPLSFSPKPTRLFSSSYFHFSINPNLISFIKEGLHFEEERSKKRSRRDRWLRTQGKLSLEGNVAWSKAESPPPHRFLRNLSDDHKLIVYVSVPSDQASFPSIVASILVRSHWSISRWVVFEFSLLSWVFVVLEINLVNYLADWCNDEKLSLNM